MRKRIKKWSKNESSTKKLKTTNENLKNQNLDTIDLKRSYIEYYDVNEIDLNQSQTDLSKYWYQRYDIFSKFDYGIKLDEESWYSANIEKIANHVTSRCQNDIFLDIFCGAGSTCIQAAFHFLNVLGIDNDMFKLQAAKENTKIYGVSEYVDFICGDYKDVIKAFRNPFVDVIFIDIPWGGPDYLLQTKIDCLDKNFSCINLKQAFNLCRKHTKDLVIRLPRNTSLKSIGMLFGTNEPFEIEKNYLRGRIKCINVYSGNIITKYENSKAENTLSENKKQPRELKYKTYHDNDERETIDLALMETDEIHYPIIRLKACNGNVITDDTYDSNMNLDDPFMKELKSLNSYLRNK